MKNIIIDTDPGIDDILAILFAIKSKKINVEGLITVGGNVPVSIGTKNALKILEIINREDIPVISGATRPLKREPLTAEIVHGSDGMANLNLSEPKIKEIDLTVVEWLKNILLNSKKPISIVALAPLTNLAILYILEPKAFKQIEEIIFMGGSVFSPGNITKSAEFNIYVDPDAAKVVFNSGIKLKMVGLDVTMKTILKKKEIHKLKKEEGRTINFVYELMSKALEIMPGGIENGGIALHDPLAIGASVYDDILNFKEYFLSVETEGKESLGTTFVDSRIWSEKKANAEIAVEVNDKLFIKMFIDTLKS